MSCSPCVRKPSRSSQGAALHQGRKEGLHFGVNVNISRIIKNRKFKYKQNSKTGTNSTVSYQEVTKLPKRIGRKEMERAQMSAVCQWT